MRVFLLVSFFCIINGFISGKNKLNKSKFVLRSKMLPSSEITGGLNNKLGEAWSYSDLFEYSKDNMIHSLTITEDGKNAFVLDNLSSENGNLHLVRLFPDNLNNLIDHLINHNIQFDIFQMPKNEFLEIVSKFGEAVFNVGIYFLAISLIVRIFSGMSNFTPNGGGNPLNPLQGGNNINEIDSEMLETTFDDVAGCEESKFELMEVVIF